MMQAVRGVYRGGVVELLEKPEISGEVEVVVTFLGSAIESLAGQIVAPDEPGGLEDFEPIVPQKPILLSDLVLEGRE
jgi:hypothetical protein